MLHNRNPSDADYDDQPEPGRTGRAHESRTWGPFTGGQLAAIIITLAVVIGFPVGAHAVVSGSNVFVTDATGGTHAAVDSAAALNVTEAPPKNFIVGQAIVTAQPYAVLAAPTPHHALVITSLQINSYTNTTPANADVDFAISATDATCNNLVNSFVLNVAIPSLGPITIPFHPGFVVPAGRALCVHNNNPAASGDSAWAFGFFVPASAAPVGQ